MTGPGKQIRGCASRNAKSHHANAVWTAQDMLLNSVINRQLVCLLLRLLLQIAGQKVNKRGGIPSCLPCVKLRILRLRPVKKSSFPIRKRQPAWARNKNRKRDCEYQNMVFKSFSLSRYALPVHKETVGQV